MILSAGDFDIAALRQWPGRREAAGDFATAFPVRAQRAPMEATATRP